MAVGWGAALLYAVAAPVGGAVLGWMLLGRALAGPSVSADAAIRARALRAVLVSGAALGLLAAAMGAGGGEAVRIPLLAVGVLACLQAIGQGFLLARSLARLSAHDATPSVAAALVALEVPTVGALAWVILSA